MKKKILVVDDEESLVRLITYNLNKEGYTTVSAYDGTTAIETARRENPDLVILDLMLPGMDGLDVCRQMRSEHIYTPIIILTAKDEEIDKVVGLELGADDYVTKPFSPRQLVARVGALLRRTKGGNYRVSSILSFNHQDLVIDTLKHEVTKNGEVLKLTPIEFSLLSTMAKTPNRTYTRDDLITYALGDEYDGFDRSLDSHIKNLRHKIETDTKNCRYILTVHGMGYKFGGE